MPIKNNAPIELPWMTTAQRDALTGVQPGQCVYNTDTKHSEVYRDGRWYGIGESWAERGHYVAERSLAQWRQAKQPVVVWHGDSTVNGDVGNNDLTNLGWGSCVELLSKQIQAFGPYVGPGFYGLWRDEWTFVAGGAPFTKATTSDAWDVGPFLSAMKSTGSTTTFAVFKIPRTVSPAFADIVFWDDTAAATANWSYQTSLDGGGTYAGAVNSNQHWTAGDPAVSRQRLAVPSGCTHIRVRAQNAAAVAKIVTLIGIELYVDDPGTTIGPLVHNLGASADLLSTYVRSTSGQPLRTVNALNPTLAIIGPFTNDSATGTTFEDNLRKLIKGLKPRVVFDGVITNASTTVTSATAAFDAAADVGKVIIGTNINTNTVIASVTNATTAVMSSAATGTASNLQLIIVPNTSKIGTDCITVNASRVVNCASGSFTQQDVGKTITGTNIPGFTLVTQVNSSTQLVMSQAATAGATTAYVVCDSALSWANSVVDPDILIIGQYNQIVQSTLANVVTTNTSTAITAPSGTFNQDHVNRDVTGTGIPVLARIASVQSSTAATLSAAASASGTITMTLLGRVQADMDGLRAACKSVARGVITEDGTSTDGSTTYTSATAAFTGDDVGKAVVGFGIQARTFIASVTNGTTIVLSRPAIGTGTGHFEMRGYAYLDMGEAWYPNGDDNYEAGLLWDEFHESQLGHREMANSVMKILAKYS